MNWVFSGPLRVETVEIAIADLAASLKGTKLVQLSDLHYDGVRLSEDLLAQAIEACNQAEPDLILLTGDYVTDDPNPIYQLVQRLKHLQSRVGIYAVLGNHDLHYRRSKAQVTDALTTIGVRVLWNEIAYPLGPELPFVGFADLWSREFNPAPVMNQLDPKTPRIILSHNPDTAELLQQWRVDLQLSGHTHGGQVVIPGFGPGPVLLEKLQPHIPKPMLDYPGTGSHEWNPAPYSQTNAALDSIHESLYQGSQALGMVPRTAPSGEQSALYQSRFGQLRARTLLVSARGYSHYSGLELKD